MKPALSEYLSYPAVLRLAQQLTFLNQATPLRLLMPYFS